MSVMAGQGRSQRGFGTLICREMERFPGRRGLRTKDHIIPVSTLHRIHSARDLRIFPRISLLPDPGRLPATRGMTIGSHSHSLAILRAGVISQALRSQVDRTGPDHRHLPGSLLARILPAALAALAFSCSPQRPRNEKRARDLPEGLREPESALLQHSRQSTLVAPLYFPAISWPSDISEPHPVVGGVSPRMDGRRLHSRWDCRAGRMGYAKGDGT
jgi:hypothetical protein